MYVPTATSYLPGTRDFHSPPGGGGILLSYPHRASNLFRNILMGF
jgi:hypothetical protein